MRDSVPSESQPGISSRTVLARMRPAGSSKTSDTQASASSAFMWFLSSFEARCLLRREAAVDGKVGAGDPACGWREHEQRSTSHVFRLPRAQRMRRLQSVDVFGRQLGQHGHSAWRVSPHYRQDPSGLDRVAGEDKAAILDIRTRDVDLDRCNPRRG